MHSHANGAAATYSVCLTNTPSPAHRPKKTSPGSFGAAPALRPLRCRKDDQSQSARGAALMLSPISSHASRSLHPLVGHRAKATAQGFFPVWIAPGFSSWCSPRPVTPTAYRSSSVDHGAPYNPIPCRPSSHPIYNPHSRAAHYLQYTHIHLFRHGERKLRNVLALPYLSYINVEFIIALLYQVNHYLVVFSCDEQARISSSRPPHGFEPKAVAP